MGDLPSTDPAVYYRRDSGHECVDVVMAWELSWALGNVVKYLCRAGRKAGATLLDDLRKAHDLLGREIRRLEAAGAATAPSDLWARMAAVGCERDRGGWWRSASGQLLVFPHPSGRGGWSYYGIAGEALAATEGEALERLLAGPHAPVAAS